jgi:type IV pilus assembly protein PilW
MKRMNPTFASQRGLSLVELLVALVIGSLLIIGAVFVYSQSRKTHALSETVARLQENARFIMAFMEPDLQLAGNYGYSNVPSDIRYSDDTYVSDMQAGDAKFGSGPAAEHTCGNNFSLDLTATVLGVENSYGLACGAFGAGAAAGADTLIIRRASTTSQAASNKKLQLLANRLSPTNQILFSSNTVPGGVTKVDFLEVRDILTNVYYVSQDSDDRAGYPSLRRKWLGLDGSGNLDMNDEEIMAGVEDLQVQFGIDMGADTNGDGVADDDDNNGVADAVNGQASRYVNPDDAAAMKFGQIVSVRMWVRLRAEQGEVGFKNTTHYTYGSTDFTANDNIRRIVATRTFFLRNTRVLRN